jgi:hypothetical protein
VFILPALIAAVAYLRDTKIESLPQKLLTLKLCLFHIPKMSASPRKASQTSAEKRAANAARRPSDIGRIVSSELNECTELICHN